MTETTWLTVVLIAAGAQLAVLPGEKVQLLIAGLSTRYRPAVVVSAAAAAFAGWTVLEIRFGQAITEALPGIYLDAMTAVLFSVFAYLLYRSAPDPDADDPEAATGSLTDGGELDVRVPLVGWRVPNRFGGFLPIFAMMAFGEFGDKTQLVTISLATQYGAFPTAIWTGEMLAIIPISLANAYFFHRFSHRFDLRKAHFAGAALFCFFALDFAASVLLGFSLWETGIDALAGAV
ncbi:Putative Ca2+/H+ antiporter, TMEM165/GDT1 family [Halorubrum aquaticum]|uniref:Ca2+/H+ antiporter, TMEM165/GDT1 family n=1 Tax=Halorubrum aquaticum TaxID=387340 RepID=A0A1I3AU27_9EURY|nr:TMEM165/GDT1 family protein [Halorubrum aquaticum]SFH53587.1 Putative Ca2+/H+ antiporter, TMEM165/GDT1 family [Halorubrum aquaticum]